MCLFAYLLSIWKELGVNYVLLTMLSTVFGWFAKFYRMGRLTWFLLLEFVKVDNSFVSAFPRLNSP